MKALLVNVAPLTVEMLPDWAAMTRDLRVGTAWLVIVVDVDVVLAVVALTDVILPPDTVIETATDPYWCATVGPANVPFLKPLTGGAVVGLAVVAGAAGVVVVGAAGAEVVPALVAAAVVPALVAVVGAAAAADFDDCTAAEAAAAVPVVSEASVPVVCASVEASVATATADGSPDVTDVGSVATARRPAADV